MNGSRVLWLGVGVALALSTAGGGCGGHGGPGDGAKGPGDGAVAGLTVTLGTVAVDSTGFIPLGKGDPLEMIVGQQGLQFCRLRYLVTGSSGRVTANAHFEIVGETPFDRGPRPLAVEDLAGVGPVSDVHMILLGDLTIPKLVGRLATVTVSLSDDQTGATGSAAVTVELRDDDPCIDQGGGLCVKPGADAGTGTDSGTLDSGI